MVPTGNIELLVFVLHISFRGSLCEWFVISEPLADKNLAFEGAFADQAWGFVGLGVCVGVVFH